MFNVDEVGCRSLVRQILAEAGVGDSEESVVDLLVSVAQVATDDLLERAGRISTEQGRNGVVHPDDISIAGREQRCIFPSRASPIEAARRAEQINEQPLSAPLPRAELLSCRGLPAQGESSGSEFDFSDAEDLLASDEEAEGVEEGTGAPASSSRGCKLGRFGRASLRSKLQRRQQAAGPLAKRANRPSAWESPVADDVHDTLGDTSGRRGEARGAHAMPESEAGQGKRRRQSHEAWAAEIGSALAASSTEY